MRHNPEVRINIASWTIMIGTKSRSVRAPGGVPGFRGPHDFPAVQHAEAKARSAQCAEGRGEAAKRAAQPTLDRRGRLGNQSGGHFPTRIRAVNTCALGRSGRVVLGDYSPPAIRASSATSFAIITKQCHDRTRTSARYRPSKLAPSRSSRRMEKPSA